MAIKKTLLDVNILPLDREINILNSNFEINDDWSSTIKSYAPAFYFGDNDLPKENIKGKDIKNAAFKEIKNIGLYNNNIKNLNLFFSGYEMINDNKEIVVYFREVGKNEEPKTIIFKVYDTTKSEVISQLSQTLTSKKYDDDNSVKWQIKAFVSKKSSDFMSKYHHNSNVSLFVNSENVLISYKRIEFNDWTRPNLNYKEESNSILYFDYLKQLNQVKMNVKLKGEKEDDDEDEDEEDEEETSDETFEEFPEVPPPPPDPETSAGVFGFLIGLFGHDKCNKDKDKNKCKREKIKEEIKSKEIKADDYNKVISDYINDHLKNGNDNEIEAFKAKFKIKLEQEVWKSIQNHLEYFSTKVANKYIFDFMRELQNWENMQTYDFWNNYLNKVTNLFGENIINNYSVVQEFEFDIDKIIEEQLINDLQNELIVLNKETVLKTNNKIEQSFLKLKLNALKNNIGNIKNLPIYTSNFLNMQENIDKFNKVKQQVFNLRFRKYLDSATEYLKKIILKSNLKMESYFSEYYNDGLSSEIDRLIDEISHKYAHQQTEKVISEIIVNYIDGYVKKYLFKKVNEKFILILNEVKENTKKQILNNDFRNFITNKVQNFILEQLLKNASDSITKIKIDKILTKTIIFRIKIAIQQNEQKFYELVKIDPYGIFDVKISKYYYIFELKKIYLIDEINEKITKQNIKELELYLINKFNQLAINSKWYTEISTNDKNLNQKIKILISKNINNSIILNGIKSYFDSSKIEILTINQINNDLINVWLKYPTFSESINIILKILY